MMRKKKFFFYRKDKPEWAWSHFEVTVPMSTYLVAYSINDFEYKESVVKMTDDVLFRIWARRDALDQVRHFFSIEMLKPVSFE